MTQLAEMFYSIRGEGYHAGSPALFLRFPACNLACRGCDTYFNRFFEIEPEEIRRYALRVSARNIVFTGGEPMLRVSEINQLIATLNEAGDLGYQIETNGTVSCADLDPRVWITVAPKCGQPYGKGGPSNWQGNLAKGSRLVTEKELDRETLAGADEVKYIVGIQEGFDSPQDIDTYVMDVRGDIIPPHRYLQPWAGRWYQQNLEAAMQMVYDHPLRWKLGLQLHKVLGVQ